MQLNLYLAPRGKVAELAAKLDVPAPLVSQWKSGERPVPIERCVPVEKATGGEVRRWDLRPADWFLIWPELINAEGAPEIGEVA